jgi:hypothetical protein
MTRWTPHRIAATHIMTLPAPPEKVYPLLCPVRERDWLPGWRCKMIYSSSGLAEKDCVFSVDSRGFGEEIWTCTQYQPPREVSYVVTIPHVAVTHLTMWAYTATELSPDGSADLRRFEAKAFRSEGDGLQRMLTHYLRTGAMLAGDLAEG